MAVGSHCRSRGNLDNVKPAQLRKRVRRTLDTAPLRTLLGFVPLRDDGRPVPNSGLALPLGGEKGSLRSAIESEGGYLADALKWPAKENGLDIEGIAVDDTEILLGLRGPAAGGFAIVMRLSVAIGDKCLSLRKRNGQRYRLSFLQLNGLGIRDLVRRGRRPARARWPEHGSRCSLRALPLAWRIRPRLIEGREGQVGYRASGISVRFRAG